MTDTHGRLFDTFSRQASHTHGGSYFDEGFGHATLSEAHGKLYDRFGVPRDNAAHGDRFDEFGWNAMPVLHGPQYDSDFAAPTAHNTDHGTWFDVFRGGTEVRCVIEGADYEGTVVECHPSHAVVRGQDGQTHEVGLSQFLAYRTPTQQQASPPMPASTAHAPSARSSDAHGAFHGDRAPVPTDMPPVIQEVPQGQHTDARSGLPAGLMDTFTHLKSLADELDVEKDVDAKETATQGAPAKSVGHRGNCPRGGSGPCGADVDGKCTQCNATVRDHEAVGKSAPIQSSTGALGITVPEREHKTTDHHTTGAKPGRCPHCGQEMLDHQTEQGQPSRREKQGGESDFNVTAHKCSGTGLDVLKSLETA